MNQPEMGIHAIVCGRVQGVGFRWYTRKKAEALALDGWVRNLENGSVEAFFCGEKKNMEQMRAYLAKGPISSRVDSLVCRDEKRVNVADGFCVRDTAAGENHA